MELLERILKQNPWWENKQITAIAGLNKRKLFDDVGSYTDKKQIISIIGLRRVGKTVLLFQIIDALLKKINPKRILYFSFDEILGKDPDIIEKVLEVYENEIFKEELNRVFIFFDELNHIKDWQVILKRYYDLDMGIKFFVSGSSSLYLKKTKESLAGRIYEFELKPLSLSEYLSLKNIRIKDLAIGSLTIKRELTGYLISGAFPELINEKEFTNIKRYVVSIIDKIIFYDIPKIYNIEEPELLSEILRLIAKNPGMLMDYQSLSSSLNMSYQTISKYVSYLEKAFLIRLLYNYRGSPIASARKLKKVYLSTPSLIAAFVDSENEFLSLLPKLAEAAVVQNLNARFFWKKYFEIDILHNKIPIEVKYQEKPDVKNNIEAVKSIKSKRLIVITKNLEKKEKVKGIHIDYIPLWRFLYLEQKL